MKFRDIIEAVGGRLNWIDIDYGWSVNDSGHILPTLAVDLTLDAEVAVIYYWYHHLNPDIDKKEIEAAIAAHDYETFIKWFTAFEADSFSYFPSEAFIAVGDEIVGTLCVVYDPKVFALITDADYECG